MKFFLCKKKILIILILIVFLTAIMLFSYNKKQSDYISNYAYDILNKFTYNLVSSYYNELIIDKEWQDVLKITRNSEGEILLVDFDLIETNKLNKKINNKLNESINSLEHGKILDKNLNITSCKNGFRMDVPFILSEKYNIFYNILPKIPVKVSFVGMVRTNIKTNVSDYGLNNTLAEIYVTIAIEESIYYPTYQNSYKLDYDVLIGSKLIQGRVPYFYGMQNGLKSQNTFKN